MTWRQSRQDFYLVRIVQQWTGDLYMVGLIHRQGDDDYEDDELCTETLQNVLFNIPRDGLYFEDVPYTRDHYMFSSFRHEMMIPDDMFPEVWKNIPV